MTTYLTSTDTIIDALDEIQDASGRASLDAVAASVDVGRVLTWAEYLATVRGTVAS